MPARRGTRTASVRRTARRDPDERRDALMLEVLAQFRVLIRAVRRHYQRVEETTGVSGAQLWFLAEVSAARGARVGEVARRLAVHQSTASNLLADLERAGLLERRREDDDRRIVRVYPTALGTRLLRKAPRPLRGVLQQGLCDLPLVSLTTLHGELGHLLERMHLRDRAGHDDLISQSQ